MGTPELGLNRTSQGDTELMLKVRGRLGRRDANRVWSPRAVETRAGGPGSRLTGPMCVDMCVHVCAMPSVLDSP